MRPPFADLGPPLPLKFPKSSAERLRETRPFKFRCCSAEHCSVSGEFRGCGPRWLTSALKRLLTKVRNLARPVSGMSGHKVGIGGSTRRY
jgi:hypothetical protein